MGEKDKKWQFIHQVELVFVLFLFDQAAILGFSI